MLWFEGCEEELGEALRLMREQNMVQGRVRVAVRRTNSLEAGERALTIPCPHHPPCGLVLRGQRLLLGHRRYPLC